VSHAATGSPVALVLSSGRTGTQFLARYFDANYEGVVARHEPPPSRSLRLVGHAYLAGAVSRETLAGFVRRKRRRALSAMTGTLYLEANPYLACTIDVLAEAWPEAVVIHLVRDPREHVRSAINNGFASGLKGFANRRVPFWYPDVARLLALDPSASDVARAAGQWALVNRRLRDQGRVHPAYHVLRYEDLFDEERSGLRALCEILGLDYCGDGAAVAPSERFNESRHQRCPAWREWTPSECRELHAICAELMHEWRYGREPEWQSRVAGDG